MKISLKRETKKINNLIEKMAIHGGCEQRNWLIINWRRRNCFKRGEFHLFHHPAESSKWTESGQRKVPLAAPFRRKEKSSQKVGEFHNQRESVRLINGHTRPVKVPHQSNRGRGTSSLACGHPQEGHSQVADRALFSKSSPPPLPLALKSVRISFASGK